MKRAMNRRAGKVIRITGWVFLMGAGLLLLGAVLFFRSALYNRFVLYPRQAAAWEALRRQAQPVTLEDGWQEYRGVCHNHTNQSHDSDGTYEQILAAARQAQVDFVLMANHCDQGIGRYSRGWEGDHEGVTFVRGYEMENGFMPWGLPENADIDCKAEPARLAQQIEDAGGLLFYAHPEESRRWDLPQLKGMEIYNFHADALKDESVSEFLRDMLFSIRSYPDQVFRRIYDRPAGVIARWDELNRTRRIAGIGGNDAHQNTGFRGYYTEKDTFQLRRRDPKGIFGEWKLNLLTRFLLRLAFGPLEQGKLLFSFTADPYERTFRFINTHILAKEKSGASILDALRAARAFVAFDMLADARGFVFMAQSGQQTAVMGEDLPFAGGITLRAESPLPCRFTLRRDGEEVRQQAGRSFEYEPDRPGNYRVECELEILGEWTPWIYSNPIRILLPGSPGEANKK